MAIKNSAVVNAYFYVFIVMIIIFLSFKENNYCDYSWNLWNFQFVYERETVNVKNNYLKIKRKLC